jgi:E3 ubiquitin-protein ligase TRIP12
MRLFRLDFYLLVVLNPLLPLCGQHPTGGTGTALGTTPPGALAGMGTTLADRDLPSVMTCANYLKLPPYSCKVSDCSE